MIGTPYKDAYALSARSGRNVMSGVEGRNSRVGIARLNRRPASDSFFLKCGAGCGGRRRHTPTFTQLGNEVWATAFVVIKHLAIQALDALIGIDRTFGLNGLDWTFNGAQLARIAAGRVTTQPVEDAQSGRDGQCGAQRT